jgi:outer membrane protein insertion porin family
MMHTISDKKVVLLCAVSMAVLFCFGCHSTRHVAEGQYLLRKNKVTLHSAGSVPNKGEVKDILSRSVAQKPNTYTFGIFPFKISFYNRRYDRLHNKPDTSLPKSVERPVLLDTAQIARTELSMRTYMFNQGYFYAKVKDTVIMRHKKARVSYRVDAGINYVIKNINYDIDDSTISRIVRANSNLSQLKKDRPFSYSLLEDERSRITSLVRDKGYYKFTQENVSFSIDTFDKSMFKDLESPFEAATNYISASHKKKEKPTLDIDVVIRLIEDTNAYKQFSIGKVNVFADYAGATDAFDTTLITKEIDKVEFKYHDYYVHSRVLNDHIFITPQHFFSQTDIDQTNAKLNELGIFQYLRIEYRQPDKNKNILDCYIYLNKTKKHDLSVNFETSSGSTYSLGHSIGVNYRDKNFAKGANLLTIGVNGGVELAYNAGSSFIKNFSLLTEYYGVNASIDFPKFLSPIGSSLFEDNNIPHTIISAGENVMDRVNYFTLINTSINFTYTWHHSQTITWSLSPVFVNIIRLPVETDSFKNVLANNAYLRNSYKENFIEGENLTFIYDDISKKHGMNYSYLKLGVEEAGALLSGVNDLGVALNDLYQIQFAQYVKFDFDARHYFTLPHSVFAFRFYGGVGEPYGQSDALPYIKQYFVGGPYSLRGWRIRTLGPGSYYDINNIDNINQLDRTGDIKLELNGEYRFPITPLFAGSVKMNGVLFADGGNIWLAKKDASYPDGNFDLKYLAQEIAADIGTGLRFDIASFLTLRVEAAIPVKKPYVSGSYGWVFNQIDLSDPTWRSNNVIVFASIGYPF